jgi:YVTN family beta-propeller protein
VADGNAPAANGLVWPLALASGDRGHNIQVSGPPFALAITPDGRLLFASDGDVITEIDVADGAVRRKIHTGIAPGPVSPPLLVSPDGRILYIAEESRIRSYDIAAGRFDQGIRADWPQAMLVSRDGMTLWYASADNTVVAVDPATGAVIASIRVKSDPVALAMTPDGRTLYVALPGSGNRGNPGEIIPVDVATGAVRPGIRTRDPEAMAMAPDGRTLYVLATPQGTNGDGPTTPGWVTPITLTSHSAGRPIHVGYAPASIVITPDGQTLYIANEDSETISVIQVSR